MSDYWNENPHTTLNRQLGLIAGVQLTLKPILVATSYLICFVLLTKIAFTLEQSSGMTLWYPSVGLNLALLLIFGLRYIPVIFIATLITGFWQWHIPFSPLALLLFSLMHTSGYGLAAFVLNNKLKIDPRLQHLRDMSWFVLVALITSLVIALLTITNFAISGLTPWPNDPSVISATWLSHALSLVTLTPFLLIYLNKLGRVRVRQKTNAHNIESKMTTPSRLIILENIGHIVAILLILYIVFGVQTFANFSLLYLCFLPLIWITLRRGLAGATTDILAINSATFFIPIFGLESNNIIELQIFMSILSLAGLFLGVVVVQYKRTLATLQAGEARFRHVISSISDHIYVTEIDERGQYVNLYLSPHIEALTGYPRAKFEADWNFWPSFVIHPQDREAAAAQSRRLAKGQDSEVEYRLVRADGDIIWVRDSGRTERQGKSTFVYGVVSDITERKTLEEKWRKYEFIVNTSKEFITLINKNYCYEAVNEAYCRALEKKREEIIAKSVANIWGEEQYRIQIKPYLDQCFTGTEIHYQEWFEFATLGCRYFDVTYYPYFDEAGHVTHTVIVLRDITKSKQAEEALQQSIQKLQVAYEHATTYAQELHQEITEREYIEEALRQSEARTRSVVDNVVDGIITVDERNLIETFNAAAEKIFGYLASEVIGENFSLLMADLEQKGMVASLSTWLDEQTENVRRSCEMLGQRKDKSTFPLDLAVSRFRLGERCMFIGIVRDITEQKHLEEQLRQAQKMEAIGQLAGGVAHDFNNILTVISGHTELLLRSSPELPGSQRRDIELIKQAGERAANLTRQLLAFSRQQTLRLQLLNLNVIVTNFKEMLPPLIGEGTVLKIDLDPELGTVKADPGQIEQVLMNLALNARDAMPRGGELIIKTANVELDEIHVKPELKITPGLYVVLTVTDTGVGMDPQTQSRVFDPFFTTKEQGKGTGLGLSTVYGIVRQSEGYIWLDSEVDQGTTFTIYLPRAGEAIEVKESQSHLTPLSGKSENGTKTVLLVEDEPSVRMITRRFLQRQNYVVLEASHPEQALELCRQHEGRIDLLITDLIMPYMNGRELAEQLTKMYVKLKVLYISGYTDDTLNEQGVLEPGVILLEKPFSSEALIGKVREALDAS